MNEKLVSIILVNYNGAKVLPGCLSTIFKQSYTNLEVILVDNASSDDSLAWLKCEYPQVRVVANRTNFGFAKACNQGVAAASGEYVSFLNYDTVVDKDWLRHLVVAAEADDAIGACMSKILLLKVLPPTINSAGGVVHFSGLSWSGSYNHADSALFSKKEDVAFASGAAMLVKRSVLDEVGLFDEDFFMYCEDTDLSWRMRLAGYRLVYVPESIVWHDYHFSKGKEKYHLLERNRLSMILTNYQSRTLAVLFLPLLILETGMLFNALVSGWLPQKLQGYSELFRGRRRIKEKRRKVQLARRLSDRDIAGMFVAKIDFDGINNALVSFLNLFLGLYWKLVFPLLK